MLQWIRAQLSNWKFKRAFDNAPIKSMPTNTIGGHMLYKEVDGNLYVVDIIEGK